MQELLSIFYIAILIISVVIHEVAHGYAALWMGDVTAKYAGRLTMNPLKHLDPIGSVILPFLLVITNAGFMIGWAKPVPYNPYNLRNQRWGELFVAIAGPLSNIAIAILLSIIIRLRFVMTLPPAFYDIAIATIFINLFLAMFNLIPIPPLDGSKIFFNLFYKNSQNIIAAITPYSIPALLLFIYFFSDLLIPVVIFLAELMTGVYMGGI